MKPIRGGLLSAVGAAFLLLALSPAISWATYPGANGRIAYVGWGGSAHPSDPSGIFTVLPDGSGLQQLTGESVSDPSWSADGRSLVYLSDGVQVFTMDADGGNQTQVTHGSVEKVNPGFSPSGRRIVYATAPYDGRPSIFKIRPDGMKKRRIVGPDATSSVFSPGGRRIAFDGTPNGARREGIWTIRRDGSHLRRLTGPREAGVVDHVLDWRPDGKHILFDRCKAEIHSCHGGNWVMRPDGSHKHPIDAPGEVYSPSGDGFAGVTAEIDDAINFDWGCSDIYTVPASGHDIDLVTHNCEDHSSGDPGPFAESPSWQPIPQP